MITVRHRVKCHVANARAVRAMRRCVAAVLARIAPRCAAPVVPDVYEARLWHGGLLVTKAANTLSAVLQWAREYVRDWQYGVCSVWLNGKYHSAHCLKDRRKTPRSTGKLVSPKQRLEDYYRGDGCVHA